MPDDNKTTDTNPAPTQDFSGVGQTIPPMEPSISTPSPPPVSLTDQGQTADTPPPAANSTVPPPPPIIEEQKEGEANIPPIVTTGEKPKGKVGKKVIATILGILFLVGGVSAGVILVQQQQDIREQAAVISNGNGGGGGTPTATPIPTSTPIATPTPWTPSPQCIADDECLGPGEDCCSSPSSGYFWASCPVTESICRSEGGTACIMDDYCLEGARDVCCNLQNYDDSTCETPIKKRCGAGEATATPVPTATPTPRPGVEISALCLNIKAFDTSWNEITDFSSLRAGDVVRFTISGTTNSGNIDKAKFRINSPTWRTTVVNKKPGTNDFYDEYTIPEGVTSFTVNAQLHHTNSAVDWF